ncbi:hypothetical protein PSECIP111951_01641 [Pseudoalteromonas holothuriae]|uniref:Uncharacterized protein n=1 Tax=Pseudoalteromonas holothuriae TaxID=2963714 RepID=A0ABM9GH45_9GAMM|nr:hypothetical protein [Pseudoalteromonas sp. CIP111951]CAH9057307.1 hypothetical protein PSECIP111951_01641 [Pseudoalteromonas sp. CIP111951]
MCFEIELAITFDAFYTFEKLAEILSPQLIEQGFKQTSLATVRKRR